MADEVAATAGAMRMRDTAGVAGQTSHREPNQPAQRTTASGPAGSLSSGVPGLPSPLFDDNGDIVFVPEQLLASQMPSRDTRRRMRGEYRLMLAVLEDAFAVLAKYQHVDAPVARELFAEAWDYIFGPPTDWLFSFETICDHLGLNPDYIRDRLRRQGMPDRKRYSYRRDMTGHGHHLGLARVDKSRDRA